jgi:TonB family protein
MAMVEGIRKFGNVGRRVIAASRFRVMTASAVILLGIFHSTSPAQTYRPGDNDRKVLSRVDPDYPDALKKLYIGGVVRVEVVVAPNGSVKSTKLLGGSPILGQSTMKAIKQWKFAPAASDETLTVKVEFDPHR